MNDQLLDAVLTRLADKPLDPPAEAFLLASMEGDGILGAATEGGRSAAGPAGSGRPSSPRPVGAFLRSISVAGFRGIGTKSELTVEPGPGLTVVCGRNGSGKSSFAEGLEVLLTGETKRWKDAKSVAVTRGWRSLHHPEAELSAEFLIEGLSAPARVARCWPDDEPRVEGSQVTVSIPGEPVTGLERLGWASALDLHRPFLSHAELEALLGAPKALHDQLTVLLGLEDLDAAEKRLVEARKGLEAIAKQSSADRVLLVEALGASEDERAVRARQLLDVKGRAKVDVDALELLATGAVSVDDGDLATLRRLRSLTPPPPDEVARAVEELDAAAGALRNANQASDIDSLATADLLQAALDHFGRHGPGECPVCSRPDALNDPWRVDTELTVAGLRESAQKLESARAEGQRSLTAARSLTAVDGTVPKTAASGIDTGAAREAWQKWTTTALEEPTADNLAALARHLKETYPTLVETTTQVSARADAELTRRHDSWAPLATKILEWCREARQAAAETPRTNQIKSAEKWLKETKGSVRTARFQPFASQTIALWQRLRQESNVDVLSMELSGAATHSRVQFDVTVDGKPADALGVMSQGEVNALALSVFIPRATSPTSPFRFLIIDDPVQAMDPSKVDGLAQVLVEVAQTRQVVVFTHDNRLPEAIRRLDLPGRIIQVTRKSNSVVQLAPAGDPVSRLLKDATDVARAEGVPPQVAARVVPGTCRTALEEALNDIARRRWLAEGRSHLQVEEALESLTTTTTRAAAAIFGDPQEGGQVLPWIDRTLGHSAADAFRLCRSGAHEGTLDAPRLIVATRDLIDGIQRELR